MVSQSNCGIRSGGVVSKACTSAVLKKSDRTGTGTDSCASNIGLFPSLILKDPSLQFGQSLDSLWRRIIFTSWTNSAASRHRSLPKTCFSTSPRVNFWFFFARLCSKATVTSRIREPRVLLSACSRKEGAVLYKCCSSASASLGSGESSCLIVWASFFSLESRKVGVRKILRE